jgi:hypothetical protein
VIVAPLFLIIYSSPAGSIRNIDKIKLQSAELQEVSGKEFKASLHELQIGPKKKGKIGDELGPNINGWTWPDWDA